MDDKESDYKSEDQAGKTQEASVQQKGTYVHKFRTPFEYEGKKYETLNFYFDKLKGKDVISIETEMQAMNEYVLAPEISSSFLCKMAAKAAGVGSDVIENMPMGEFSKIKNVARNFLISAGY